MSTVDLNMAIQHLNCWTQSLMALSTFDYVHRSREQINEKSDFAIFSL